MNRALACLAGLLIAGCQSTPVADPSIVVGNWEWESACCSIAGMAKTPATEGYSYVLQFSAEGLVRAYRGNDLVIQTRYTVHQSRPDPLADQITTVRYANPLPLGAGIVPAEEQTVFRLENGTLRLVTTGCADCFGDWRFLPQLTTGGQGG